MTVDKIELSPIIVLPSEFSNSAEHIAVFTLPHPSNNESKSRLKLIQGSNGQIFELRSHQFSKSCAYNAKSDLADDKYHYTADEQPLKSVFLTNEADRSDGHVLEAGGFQFTIKYDLTFSLIGYYYKGSVVSEERDYIREAANIKGKQSQSEESKCLTVRDYHDLLTDSHDLQWSKIPLETLQKTLSNVAEPIEEAGEIYYKMTAAKITTYLIEKVQKMLPKLPKSLPISTDLPPHVLEAAKIITSVNLLISLIPKASYQHLVHFSPNPDHTNEPQLDIHKAYTTFRDYQKSKTISDMDQELQLKAAMTVGLSASSAKQPSKKVVKKTAVISKKTNVKSGKGSIDGFFKKSNPITRQKDSS